ncbi:carbohydrate-binding domain-containing protein [Romboutsia ilealis]|uniref:carbohydrate-binding domain-containing protein n=2 Tax=Romboutsia ilealis TaxID=1115758 RepID=UPI0027303B7D|nr:carbohydrate-binding domain-containing protein [Romboutsia ilealis]
MNKKLVAMLSALSLCVTVTACSKSEENTKSQSSTNKTSINIESLDNESVSDPDTYIKLGTETTVEGQGAEVSNNKVTITKAGTYSVSGKIEDGQILVDAGAEDKVYLILNGADIKCSNSAPIYVKNAKKAIISLAGGTENNITDGETYMFEDESSNDPNAAIFSKDDMTIIGTGKLTVNANYNNGIASNDDLKIQSGNIVVNAKNNGIKGKDCINVTDGNITINSKGDGLKADNTTDETKGYIYIEGGKINITSSQDGIQAETELLIADGDITIKTGGGSENSIKSNRAPGKMPEGMTKGERPTIPDGKIQGEVPALPDGQTKGERPEMPQDIRYPSSNQDTSKNSNTDVSTNTSTDENTSMKGLKATTNIVIDGGTFNIDSEDDSIHSNANAIINSGTFEIASGDDGIHSDTKLDINGGTINISKSYEGIESTTININDGNIHVVASDDGINAAGGNDVSTETGMPGNDKFSLSGDALININGGYVYVDASGDGIDANGSINMVGGTVLVNGPTNNGNGSLDYDETFDISGGTLVAAGSAGMAQMPSDSSSQKILNLSLTSQESNTVVNIKSSDGKNILTYSPSKNYSSVIVSTPDIKDNTKYTVSVGGTAKGEAKDGLYYDGNYSGGTEVGSETISSTIANITQEGASTNSMGGHGGQGGRPGGKGHKMQPNTSGQTNNQINSQITEQ